MLTVMELLSQPVFRNFRLACGISGLNNRITGTGIFEWESFEEVDKTFLEGEFVMTTLSQAKYDPSIAYNCLKMLVEKGVSGIAIKTIYFDEIPESFKTFADVSNIPIFFFENTYFDDIIFTIKSLLNVNITQIDNTEKVNILFNSNSDLDMNAKVAKEINPFFFNHIICCFASPKGVLIKKGGNSENDCLEDIIAECNHNLDSSDTICSTIKYGYGILIIYTVKNLPVDLYTDFKCFLGQLESKHKLECLGVSNTHLGLENLGTSIKESIYSNISCLIDKEPIMDFSSTGLDQLLIPSSTNKWVKNYYDSLFDKISAYDEVNDQNLMETLLQYIQSGGNIVLTSQIIFQHSNTVRYRIGKIKKVLGFDENADCYPQLFIIARLYRIYQYLDRF